eukprot:CAMPEP_0174851968 /NCGR_PEP_ID=MMETSP1114-20130205/24775_1 /TAXON_ID=312471 /ORGANISM="Neobodo designis, Strain CCAP 1951/1" /LENGTH=447 /DNA_ID=CAMNT_0016086537 /DNA_START=34 /DNA_END=1377 /DNA_ORIENTATION=+
MSFRELRTFTETMRWLGYERPISVESFRTPNIELVAEVVHWLVRRYDPSCDIPFEIEHEGERIAFFRAVCETVLHKARVKLNMKKLYQADGYAVQELLKLALLIKQGTIIAGEEHTTDYASLHAQIASRGHQDARTVRELCGSLTSDGSALFHLVESEMKARGPRERILTRATEISDFERRLRDLVSSVSQEVESTNQQVQSLSADEQSLEQKIENKKAQLDRAQKRLKGLMAVRPAFMDEYEKFEAELHQQFVVYLEQYRNLEYLESLLAKFNKVEDEMLKEQETKLRIMREKLRKEELKVLRGETVPDDGSNVFAADFGGGGGRGGGEVAQRPRAASGRVRPPTSEAGPRGGAPAGSSSGGFGGGGGGGGMGGMYGGGMSSDDDDDDDDDDTDEDTDDDSVEDDTGDLDDDGLSDDDDDDLSDDDDDDDSDDSDDDSDDDDSDSM